MQRLVIEVDDEIAEAMLEIARRTGTPPDVITGAVFHLGVHMATVVETLNHCPAVAALYSSEP